MKHESLWQVAVETREGKAILVGPAMIRAACENLCRKIAAGIRAGKEREWSNPHLIEVPKIIHQRPSGPWADGLSLN